MSADFKLLFVADVIGKPGRAAVAALLPRIREEHSVDMAVVNGENAAGGFGLTRALVDEFVRAGADVVTSGNHVWKQKEFSGEIDTVERVLRPANFPPGAPGRGHLVVEAGGERVLVMNLMGRLFMEPLDCPFRAADAILGEPDVPHIVLCDMHAEATSEKVAMGWYLDGRSSAVVGTHTHVPTADQRVLPGGTAYCTDVGMVGPRDGVIGVGRTEVLRKFVSGMPERWSVAEGTVTFNSVLITIDRLTGRARSIQRIDQEHN